MQGTITSGGVTVNRNPWRTDKPPVGHVVEVWLSIAVVLALAWTDLYEHTGSDGARA